MKCVTFDRKAIETDYLLWRCLIGCGHAILTGSENNSEDVYICRSNDDRKPFTLFCKSLDLRLMQDQNKLPLTKNKYLSETSLEDTSFSFVESKYGLGDCQGDEKFEVSVMREAIAKWSSILPPLRCLSEALREWKVFLGSEEIVQARNDIKLGCPVEIPNLMCTWHLEQRIARYCPPTREFTSEKDLLKHIAYKWLDQYSRIYHAHAKKASQIEIPGSKLRQQIRMPVRRIVDENANDKLDENKAERIMAEFQEMFIFLQGKHASFIDTLKPFPRTVEYRKDLAKFLEGYRSGALNTLHKVADLTNTIPYLNAGTDLLEFCDDALNKASMLFNKSEFEPVVMRLVDLRASAVLLLFGNSEIFPVEQCTKNSAHGSNYCGSEEQLAERTVIFNRAKVLLDTIKIVTNQMSDFAMTRRRNSKSRQNSVLKISNLAQKFNPSDDCIACSLKYFECYLSKLEKLRRSNRATVRQVKFKSSATKPSGFGEPRLITQVRTEFAQEETHTYMKTLRHELVQLLPIENTSQLQTEFECQDDSRISFGISLLSQLQRWILTTADNHQLYQTLQQLYPFMQKLRIRISDESVRIMMKHVKLIDNGLSVPETVASILLLCNAITRDVENHKRNHFHRHYCRLLGLVEKINEMNSINGIVTLPNQSIATGERLRLRAIVNLGPRESEMKSLGKALNKALNAKWMLIGPAMRKDLLNLSLEDDFQKSYTKATEYIKNYIQYLQALPSKDYGWNHKEAVVSDSADT